MLSVFLLVNQVWALNNGGYSHPSLWFKDLILEREILGNGWSEEFGGEQPDGKKELLAFIGNQNKMLRSFENPFTTPAAKQLIAYAAGLAEGHGAINSRFYRPFVQARMKFLSEQRTVSTYTKTSTGEKKLCRQGRKISEQNKKMNSVTIAV